MYRFYQSYIYCRNKKTDNIRKMNRKRYYRFLNIYKIENVALQVPVFDMSVLLLVEHIVALQILIRRISVLLLVEHIIYRSL